jgi:hypothetical protein
MFSFKNWKKDTPAKISLFIKTVTAIPTVILVLDDYPKIALIVAVLGALIDTFFSGNKPPTDETQP